VRIHANDITGNLRIGIGLFGEAEGAKITGNDLSDTVGFVHPDGSGLFLLWGIHVTGANAHINNGSIVDINCPAQSQFLIKRDCSGIALAGDVHGARINNMSLHNNNVGILGFRVGNADEVRIHANDITGNLRIGIGLFGEAEGAKITGNDLSDTVGFARASC
jgi:nitrous oxidase accessory protein NosD